MDIFDIKNMKAYPPKERQKNVLYETEGFKVRVIDLPAEGQMPPCLMESFVLFQVVSGSAEVTVDGKAAAIHEGQCLVTPTATLSMRTATGVRMLGVQVGTKSPAPLDSKTPPGSS